MVESNYWQQDLSVCHIYAGETKRNINGIKDGARGLGTQPLLP